MRPPDQIPNRKLAAFDRGDVVYLWTGCAYSEKKVVAQHDFQSALTLQDGHGQMIVKPEQVIGAEQIYEEQREEVRERYKEIIHHWEAGLRKSKDLAPLIGESTRATGQMIAAAKRWKLIE